MSYNNGLWGKAGKGRDEGAQKPKGRFKTCGTLTEVRERQEVKLRAKGKSMENENGKHTNESSFSAIFSCT